MRGDISWSPGLRVDLSQKKKKTLAPAPILCLSLKCWQQRQEAVPASDLSSPLPQHSRSSQLGGHLRVICGGQQQLLNDREAGVGLARVASVYLS